MNQGNIKRCDTYSLATNLLQCDKPITIPRGKRNECICNQINKNMKSPAMTTLTVENQSVIDFDV